MNTAQRNAMQQIVAWYEHLRPDTVRRASEFYDPDVHFRDPFNDVRGVPAIERVLSHMFRQVGQARFVVLSAAEADSHAVLVWEFHFVLRGRSRCLEGATALHFDEAGRVHAHYDYWDAASQLFVHLPLVGPLTRWITRRLSA